MVARPHAKSFDPIWPLRSDLQIENTDEIQGISPIPSIWVIGAYETGKSSFIATVDPVRPGEATRTLVTDLEMSSTTVRTQLPVDVADIRKMAEAKTPVGSNVPFLLRLFETWHKYVVDEAPDNYTVLGVDPASDLKAGANLWVRQHAELFGKSPQMYNGKEGTIFAWGDTNLYWKQIIMKLAGRYQTTVLTSHEADEFKNNQRTGKKTARSTDFSEIATLTLWLSYDRKTRERWASVEKSRLAWFDWGTEDAPRRRPIQRELLPKKLVPQYVGQSYPELIAHYMEAPERDYGSLNEITERPSDDKMTDEERLRITAEQKQAELELATTEGRKELVRDLISAGLYANGSAIAAKVSELGLSYSIAQHDAIYKALSDAAQS